MSISKSAALLALLVVAEARFGQEQVPVDAVQALDGQFGDAGVAATIAGSIPQALLAASSPCDKVRLFLNHQRICLTRNSLPLRTK